MSPNPSTDQSYPRNQWYAAGWSRELSTPILRRKLLGRELAIFRDSKGALAAIDACCPHRGADLGYGKLIDGELECPFHGWRFNGEGQCTAVPSQPKEDAIPPGAKAERYRIREQQGLLWIWMGKSEPDPPLPRRWDFWEPQTKSRRIDLDAQKWSAGYVPVVEQTIDEAHPAFVHKRTLPERGEALVPALRIVEDEDGKGFRWEKAPQDQAATQSADPFWRRFVREKIQGIVGPEQERYSRLEQGGILHLHVLYADHRWDTLIFAITPRDEESSWSFVSSVRTRATHFLGEILQRRFLKNLVEDDLELAENLLEKKAGGFPTRVSVRADAPSLVFRRLHSSWIKKEEGS